MRLILSIFIWCLMAVGVCAQDGIRISMPMIFGVDGERYVSMIIRGNERYVEGVDLHQWAEENLSRVTFVSFEKVLAENGGNFPVGAMSGVEGFWIQYDEGHSALSINLFPEAMKTKTLSLQYAYEHEARIAKYSDVPTAYLNLYAGMDYLHKTVFVTGQETGREPVRLDLDGAVSVGRFVLEGRGGYQEDAPIRKWQRNNVRLVHDAPKEMIRYAAGDLSYPVVGFQSFASMAGVSMAKNFSLQPYIITEPTGQSSFLLTSPSRVEVYVNDMMVRVMQLNPGSYNVNDFPITDGANDVRLVITDAAGREEVRYFPLVSDNQLLKAGLREYSYNVGVLSHVEDREIKYESDKPAFSGFYRYGVNDVLTAGVSAQAAKEVQQIGAHVVRTFSWGTVAVDGAVSHAEHVGSDGAVQVGYTYRQNDTGQNLNVLFDYKGADFSVLGDDKSFNNYTWGLAARYGQPVGAYVMNVGGRYRKARYDYTDDWSYGVGISRGFSYNIMANVNIEHRQRDGAGVLLGVSWSPSYTRHRAYASADTLNHSQDVRWTWHDGKGLDVGAGVRRDRHTERAEGNAEYRGGRGQVGVRHDISRLVVPERKPGYYKDGAIEQRTRLTGAVGIAFAKKYVAISKPIQNGFVMVRKHENLKGNNIGINPVYAQGKPYYTEHIDEFGPAVISDATPYMYRNFTVDVRNLPADYEIEQDQFVAMPSYKSGVLVSVGAHANVHVDGYLQFENGEPVKLQAGVVRAVAVEDEFREIEFFTNAEGRFRITRLHPGSYEILMHEAPDAPVNFVIPAKTKAGLLDVGILKMAQGE